VWLLLALAGACLLGAALAFPGMLPGWERPEFFTYAQNRRIVEEILQAAQVCRDTRAGASGQMDQAAIDAVEQGLTQAGFATVDTDARYPSYLTNAQRLRSFCDAASAGEDAGLTVLCVNGDGGFSHLRFVVQGGTGYFLRTIVCLGEDGGATVSHCETLPLFDMELAPWGIFYYRVYPEDDPHYIDYSQFRLEPVDRTCFDLCRTYVVGVGYQLVNLFLQDWQEGEWEKFSMNDLFDAFYQMGTGEMPVWEDFAPHPSKPWFSVPEALFEQTVMPHFQISLEAFRAACRYDADTGTYPWRPIYGNDLTTWRQPVCEPEVVAYTERPDGTITLSVQVYSPEVKTDRLFAHELTVRPLPGGIFQYVSNRVTDTGPYGLPPAMSRFSLDRG